MSEVIIIQALEGALALARTIKSLIDDDPTIDNKIKERAARAIANARKDLEDAEAEEQAILDGIKKKIGL